MMLCNRAADLKDPEAVMWKQKRKLVAEAPEAVIFL